MARKSRKNAQQGIVTQEQKVIYKTAVYARLSIEDNGIEGDSMENQIAVIEQYLETMPELEYVRTFADNGQTGTDFERPAFVEMMEAVKAGTINCIVVKDLSRFGRNYLETGNYLEKIFPYLGVRFISVNDHFDSFCMGKSDTLLVPLKAILHDTYAKDISKKVSTAIDIKKKSGKFMGKIPPYGYVRDPQDRYKLLIHQERANVVRQIFKWRKEGLGSTTIAHRLNDLGVPTQFQIRFLEGHPDGKEDALWRGSVINDLLKNPCYIGCMVERKGSNPLYKGRVNIKIPFSQQKLIENTHEAIIDRETFETVRRLMEESRNTREQQMQKYPHRQRTENLLSGLVRCGICGGSVYRDGGYFQKDGTLVHYSYYCRNRYAKTGGCTLKAMDETTIYHCLFETCKKQLELLADRKALAEDMIRAEKENPLMIRLKEQISEIKQEQRKLCRKRKDLYADLKEGLLSEKDYCFVKDKYEKERENLEDRIRIYEHKLQEIQKLPTVDMTWTEKLLQFKNATHLTKKMCHVMIERVVLYGNAIRVHFNFADEYANPLSFLDGYTQGEDKG